MLKITNDIEEIQEGTFKRLPAGAYKCVIMAAEDVPEKNYAKFKLDILVGEYANFFSDPYYTEHPGNCTVYMSYSTPKALGFTKGRLKTITKCNPGFDAEAMWNGAAENPVLFQQFVGKIVGAVFQAEEYMDEKTGEVKVGNCRVNRLCDVADIDAGTVEIPEVKKYSGPVVRKPTVVTYQGQPAAVYDADVPFPVVPGM